MQMLEKQAPNWPAGGRPAAGFVFARSVRFGTEWVLIPAGGVLIIDEGGT